MDVDSVTNAVIGASTNVHKELGPGLLESAYETCLCYELKTKGLSFIRQQDVAVTYKEIKLDCGYRLDLVVENKLIVELKSVDKLIPLHDAQLLSYLKLTNIHVGLLINFNVPVLIKEIRRKVLNYAN
jgi:GxxExxY protein